MSPIVFIPGFGDSGPTHWQSIWQSSMAGSERVQMGDWLNPEAERWEECLREHLGIRTGRRVLVAHSLGCLAVARYIARFGADCVAGAFFVAPPDPGRAGFPSAIMGFSVIPTAPLGVPAIVVSSTNDPYCEQGFGLWCASKWGAQHQSVENAGHINAESGYGAWESGKRLLNQVRGRLL